VIAVRHELDTILDELARADDRRLSAIHGIRPRLCRQVIGVGVVPLDTDSLTGTLSAKLR